MTEQLERELRLLFAEDAEGAPHPDGLAARARGRAGQTRRRTVWGAGLLAAASVTGVVLGVQAMAPPAAPPTTAAPEVSSDPQDAPQSTLKGALTGSAMASCVEQYSPTTVAGLAFAFDGTVTEIGPGRTDRPGQGALGYAGVTFEVTEWFHGGDGSTVTVDVSAPTDVVVSGEDVPSYAPGTRLLVSGQPRWGGAPLDDPIAWGCGFTRYYDEATADRWRAGE